MTQLPNKESSCLALNNTSSSEKYYLFINNNLTDLNDPLTDLHDYACFKHIDPLNHSTIRFTDYSIVGLGLSTADSLTLNPLFKAIGEIIIHLHDQNAVNICYKTNRTDPNNNTNGVENALVCKCIVNTVNLSHSYLVGFFLDSLNANFFKYKQLIAYLSKTIDCLRGTRDSMVPDQSGQLKFNQQDLSAPLDTSVKSIMILEEIHLFLTSNCTLSLFKTALKQNFRDRKLSIYLNLYSNKNLIRNN